MSSGSWSRLAEERVSVVERFESSFAREFISVDSGQSGIGFGIPERGRSNGQLRGTVYTVCCREKVRLLESRKDIYDQYECHSACETL